MSSGFISESDLAVKRKIRQENWEKNRKEDDPEEAPEEAESLPDHRSLYERLQEQRQKKEDDWEEAHKLKNMVRGLEDDEVDFLDLVDRTKLREDQRVKKEEQTALTEYRKKVAEVQRKASESELDAGCSDSKKSNTAGNKKQSQMSLLSGAIKRKRSPDSSSASKSVKQDSADAKGHMKCIAILPGIGNYTDSSDSDNTNTSDEETIVHHHPRDLTGRLLKVASSSGGQAECC